jgi:hypothetical protein
MSTELPFIEAQIDAFTNTIWWSLDEKFGRVIRPSIRQNPSIFTLASGHIQRTWDSVSMRLTLAFVLPYIFRYVMTVENPFRLGLGLVGFCIVWPWIYQIFIYSWFLDPLRHLPAPKARSCVS